jgi:hypothetical protein
MRKSPSQQKKTTKMCACTWFIEPNIRRTIRKLEILNIFSDMETTLVYRFVRKINMLELKLIEYLVWKLLIHYVFACAYHVDGWICSNKYLNNFLITIKFSILFWRSCKIISSDHHAQCFSSRNCNKQQIFENKHAHIHFRFRFRRPLVRIAWFHISERSIVPLYVRPSVNNCLTDNHN